MIKLLVRAFQLIRKFYKVNLMKLNQNIIQTRVKIVMIGKRIIKSKMKNHSFNNHQLRKVKINKTQNHFQKYNHDLKMKSKSPI